MWWSVVSPLCDITVSINAPGLAPCSTKLTSVILPPTTSFTFSIKLLALIDIALMSPCLTICLAWLAVSVPLK